MRESLLFPRQDETIQIQNRRKSGIQNSLVSSRFILWPLEERPSLRVEGGFGTRFERNTCGRNEVGRLRSVVSAASRCNINDDGRPSPLLSIPSSPRSHGGCNFCDNTPSRPYSLILITRLISISMSPLMAIGIITVATVRPPFFFFFFEISLSFSTFFIGFRSRRESSNAFFRSYRFTHLSANSP